MNALFEVDATSIVRLNKEGFGDVLNRLIRAEASQQGLSTTQVYTSLRIDDPDGGIDAAVRDCAVVSDWIPIGHSVWQFKSGKVPVDKIRLSFRGGESESASHTGCG
ncbi:MAG TPA: hypothetical protein VKU00_32675 [Chthonomonadaceae bacterium]|nr:hypothetical protein [Chthonomonadaceae bacterium]